jgi:uncharacterized protein YpmB
MSTLNYIIIIIIIIIIIRGIADKFKQAMAEPEDSGRLISG